MKLKLCILLLLLLMSSKSWASGWDYSDGIHPLDINGKLDKISSKKLVALGMDYCDRDMSDSAMACFTVVANRRYSASGDSSQLRQCAIAIKEIGNLYRSYYNNYLLAANNYHLAMKLARDNGFKDLEVMCLNHFTALDVAHEFFVSDKTLGQDSILARYITVLDMGVRYGIGNGDLALIANNIALCSYDYDKVGQAREAMYRFLQLTREDRSVAVVSARLLTQAVLEADEGRGVHPVTLLDSAISLATSVGNRAQLYTIKFFVLERNGLDSEAIAVYQQCEQYARAHKRHAFLADIYYNLMEFYRRRGNQALADSNEVKFLREKNYVLTRAKLIDLNEQNFLRRIDQANKQAEYLAYQSEFRGRILGLISAFAVLLGLLLLVIYRKYRQVREKNKELYRRSLEVLQAEHDKLEALEQQRQAARMASVPLDSEGQSQLLHRIFVVLETNPEVYKENFTLDRLAELADGKRNYVSQVINEHYHSTFNNLLAEYRIKEACRRMHDKQFNGYTLEAMAAGVGIKSRSNFQTQFKRVTGLTPSVYWRMARNGEDVPEEPVGENR